MERSGNTVKHDEGEQERFSVDPEVTVQTEMQTADVFSEIIPGLEASAQGLLDSNDPKDQALGQKRLARVVELQQFVGTIRRVCHREYSQRQQRYR